MEGRRGREGGSKETRGALKWGRGRRGGREGGRGKEGERASLRPSRRTRWRRKKVLGFYIFLSIFHLFIFLFS